MKIFSKMFFGTLLIFISFCSTVSGQSFSYNSFLKDGNTWTFLNYPGTSDLFHSYTDAYGINDAGQIVGGYWFATVPEPSTMLLLGSGLLGSIGLRSKLSK